MGNTPSLYSVDCANDSTSSESSTYGAGSPDYANFTIKNIYGYVHRCSLTGTVEKETLGSETLYRIGEILIVAPAPIPELEAKIGREIILRVEEGFPLRRTLVKRVLAGT